jgi:hypothetical protein
MDPEEQVHFLAPTREQLASVAVFPLLPHLKRDIAVSAKTYVLSCSYCSSCRLDNNMHSTFMGSADSVRCELCSRPPPGIQICTS